jgi:capsular polysaccharide biosynthesis protein
LGFAPRRLHRARFKELVVLDDRGQNAFKRERYEWMRATLLAGVGLSSHPPAHPGVFVVRGSEGASRTLQGESELAAALAQRRGLRTVDPMRTSALDIVRACAGARVVVGVEGSALVHALTVASPGAALICLQPPWRFNNHLKDITDCRDMTYGFVVGLPSENGFTIPLDEIERTLDLVEAGEARDSQEAS